MFRSAIVGSGFIGQVHLEALRRMGNVEVAAISDLDADASSRLHCRSFADYREMVEETNPHVLHVCSPNHTHYEICRFALERGIHVLCEKPFTLEAGQARELAELAEEKHLRGGVNFHNRMYPMARQAKALVRGGEFGGIVTVHGSYLQDWLLYETDYSWRLLPEKAGKTRALADIGSHWLDLMEYVTGLRVVEVIARLHTHYPERKRPRFQPKTFDAVGDDSAEAFAVDTEDCVSILFTLENGAPGNLLVSQMFAGKKNQLSLLISGERMSAQWESEDCNNLVVGRRDAPNLLYTKDKAMLCQDAGRLAAYPGGHVEGFADAVLQGVRQFYRSIEQPDASWEYATFRDGLRQVKLCEKIWRSARERTFIAVEEGHG